MNSNVPCCRFCTKELHDTFCDLGKTPLANSYLSSQKEVQQESFYPLHAFVCKNCLLVQIEEFETPQKIFEEYSYFSSYSDTWLTHAKHYTSDMISRLNLTSESHVIEIASNDGYLLQFFLEKKISVLGIEPAKNVALVAQKKGIPTLIEFFGSKLALSQQKQGDLIIANNVLAHVPDLHDFLEGIKLLLAPYGVATIECPHLLRLIEECQFDTIYHEHFSYLSLHVLEKVFMAHGLKLFDVETLSTHGGSLRGYVSHMEDFTKEITTQVHSIKQQEKQAGLLQLDSYTTFNQRCQDIRKKFRTLLLHLKQSGHTIAAYGAPAKGNTLLNYCNIDSKLIDFTVDCNPYKQYKFLPGTHIPIYSPEELKIKHPDYIVLLPWNLKDEILSQLSWVKDWGAKWIIPIPGPVILDS